MPYRGEANHSIFCAKRRTKAAISPKPQMQALASEKDQKESKVALLKL
jgi:hypothetical protein